MRNCKPTWGLSKNRNFQGSLVIPDIWLMRNLNIVKESNDIKSHDSKAAQGSMAIDSVSNFELEVPPLNRDFVSVANPRINAAATAGTCQINMSKCR